MNNVNHVNIHSGYIGNFHDGNIGNMRYGYYVNMHSGYIGNMHNGKSFRFCKCAICEKQNFVN